MDHSILVIDDEPEIRRFLSKVFQKEHYLVFEAETGEAGIKMAQSKMPSLITLDLRLPGMSGIEACQVLKRDARTSSIPIMIITASDREGEEVITLELGADDYMTKPLEIPMLLAHVHALLRRGSYLGSQPKVLERGLLRLDMERKLVSVDGKDFDYLTPKEFDLLYVLAATEGKPMKREMIYHKVWGSPAISKSQLRTVDVHIQRVRAKLQLERTKGLVSVTGRGYMWQTEDENNPVKP
jgi:two-component system, OmpR family, phosphate regulon response regulator PhoB